MRKSEKTGRMLIIYQCPQRARCLMQVIAGWLVTSIFGKTLEQQKGIEVIKNSEIGR